MKDHQLVEEGKFKYYISGEENEEVLILLHGLLGALSNFEHIIEHFKKDYKVILPVLPIYEMPIRKVSVSGLVDHIAAFINHKGYKNVNLLGNSLGGHITLLYGLAYPENIRSLILTGSSGLFESAMGTSFPKRGNYEYMKKKAEETFYDPATATKELVDDIFETVNDRNKAIRIIATAKSAVRHNLGDKLHQIKLPTLLIWGREDIVTPLFVGEKFNELIENSELHIVEKCGHAPMMERSAQFNVILEGFFNRLKEK